MIWTLAILVYATLITVVFALACRATAKPLAADLRDLWQSARSVPAAAERAEVIKALVELQKAATPWYERTISAVGVVAFFSMSVAVTVQTIGANLQQGRAERLGAQLEDLKEERAAVEAFVAEGSRLVASRMRSGGMLSELEKTILRYRLDALEKEPAASEGAVRERFTLALALREYASAISVLENERGLLNLTTPADRLSLAEYYFLVSSHEASKQLLAEVWTERQSLARPLATRAIVLRAALGLTPDAARELAELHGLSMPEATRILDRELAAFKAGVARVDASASASGAR